jgi:hypothetical protein
MVPCSHQILHWKGWRSNQANMVETSDPSFLLVTSLCQTRFQQCEYTSISALALTVYAGIIGCGFSSRISPFHCYLWNWWSTESLKELLMCVLPGANPRPVFSIVIRAKACTGVCGNGGGGSCRGCGVFGGYTDLDWKGEDGTEKSDFAGNN